jgi:hypothetical protein
MSYRQLPEAGRARQQRDIDVARQLRFLQRRVRFPGHHRMAEEDLVVTSTPGFATYLSIEVTPGAWEITAQVGLNWENGINEQMMADMFVTTFDVETGASLGPTIEVGFAHCAQVPAIGPFLIRQPMFGMSPLNAEVTTRLDLVVSSSTVGPARQLRLTSLLLHAAPV